MTQIFLRTKARTCRGHLIIDAVNDSLLELQIYCHL